MSLRSNRRRSAPGVVWLFAIIWLAALVALALLAQIAWQRTKQLQALQAEVQALQSERQAGQAQWGALQSTATALESRLTSLEANDPARQLAALETAVATADSRQEIAALRTRLDEIQARVSSLQVALDDLGGRIQALEVAGAEVHNPPPAEVHLDVARQKQSHNLSCESAAAAMVAQYHGVPLSEADVLAALPSHANPNLGFRGNVDGPTGGLEDYGVYAGPVIAILNARGLPAWRVPDGLAGIRTAIARGNPVIAWVTYACMVSTPTTTIIEGKEVTLVPWQHVVVVTGYDSEGVWANDPWDGLEHYYTNADFERALSYFGDATSQQGMAVEVAAP